MTSDESTNPPGDGPKRRAVRSFVLRTGRATAGQQRALVELWPQYGIDFSNEPLDVNRVFPRGAQRMIEIGFGNGEALLEYARDHADIDCLGIEVHSPGVGHLLLHSQTASITNIRVMCHDAVEVLQRLPDASIDFVHIFFPDPWHKKRHHKRRIVQPPFVSLVARIIKPGGLFRLATDWEHYALHMREVLDASSEFTNVAGDRGYVDRPQLRPLTRFEKRGHRLGHGVWDMEYRRT
ncbi:tRNA (guanine-N7-)-methyltransferase [Povalibacter uvarum]|uniref:tRNA (guanine-N(7)-)-methyltransferase n=1 Tax=Povalibacter uvarum TaxID=732238 RepID=A0A841HHT4_9GAMM|nr:tRNA (guanosine(46)-N7)-methyltransferase TrmB [Povalibacter uvarum]MBB6092547.1 tRNA (guanine-N7-)-methyltransferase [Povalibacter uvarum]